MEIKTEHAVCEDCGRDIEELDEAVVLKTGEILCKECMMKYIEGNFAEALENVQEVTTGRRLAKKYLHGDSLIAFPKGRDIA